MENTNIICGSINNQKEYVLSKKEQEQIYNDIKNLYIQELNVDVDDFKYLYPKESVVLGNEKLVVGYVGEDIPRYISFGTVDTVAEDYKSLKENYFEFNQSNVNEDIQNSIFDAIYDSREDYYVDIRTGKVNDSNQDFYELDFDEYPLEAAYADMAPIYLAKGLLSGTVILSDQELEALPQFFNESDYDKFLTECMNIREQCPSVNFYYDEVNHVISDINPLEKIAISKEDIDSFQKELEIMRKIWLGERPLDTAISCNEIPEYAKSVVSEKEFNDFRNDCLKIKGLLFYPNHNFNLDTVHPELKEDILKLQAVVGGKTVITSGNSQNPIHLEYRNEFPDLLQYRMEQRFHERIEKRLYGKELSKHNNEDIKVSQFDKGRDSY